VPRIRWSVAGLSPWRPGFIPRSFQVRFVVYTVALVQVDLSAVQFHYTVAPVQVDLSAVQFH
jgi:hypothetical protein